MIVLECKLLPNTCWNIFPWISFVWKKEKTTTDTNLTFFPIWTEIIIFVFEACICEAKFSYYLLFCIVHHSNVYIVARSRRLPPLLAPLLIFYTLHMHVCCKYNMGILGCYSKLGPPFSPFWHFHYFKKEDFLVSLKLLLLCKYKVYQYQSLLP